MADAPKDPPSKIYAVDSADPKSGKNFTATPTTMDYFKEAFLPTAQRAQLEAIRTAKAKAGI